MASPVRRKRFYLAVGALGFTAAIVVQGLGGLPVPHVQWEWQQQSDPRDYTPARSDNGRELALIYVGSSACAWSNLPDLPGVVHDLKELVREKALESGRSFAVMGIAKDWSVEAGLLHLEKFGPFDEVMTGRGWLGTGALKYVYDSFPGPAATPQLLLVDRLLQQDKYSTGIIEERIILRLVGAGEIRRWLEVAAPVPGLAPVGAENDGELEGSIGRPQTAAPGSNEQ